MFVECATQNKVYLILSYLTESCFFLTINSYWHQLCTLEWCHVNIMVSKIHRQLNCLLNHLFRCISKKTSTPCITDPLWGKSTRHWMDSPHKGSVTRQKNLCHDVFINSLAFGRSHYNFGSKILKFIPQNSSLGACWEIALRWLPQNLSNVVNMVQVMAWCRQAPSHYLNQCWPRYLTSYGITRPQWVKHSKIVHPINIQTIHDLLPFVAVR